MLKQGVPDSVNLRDSFDSDFINEFTAIEKALNAELNYISPKSPTFLRSSVRSPALQFIPQFCLKIIASNF